MRPNIVLLTIDTLRPDHLGCYGYSQPTSLHIDALAAESVVFDQAFAAGIPTMPSFTTLFSGLHPYRHGITAHSSEQRLSEDIILLPQLAKQAGYVTIGIDNLVVQASGRGSWFARGFDFYSGFLYKPFSSQSEQLTDRALGYIDDYQDKPFFLYMHLWDPHTPYGPPPPYDTLHYHPEQSPPDTPSLAEVISIAPEYYEAFLGDMKLRVPDDYAYVVAQYDGEISYVDSQIGRIVAHLKMRGLWDNTIIILMSDHGECFGEGNLYFDHHGLYDAVLKIALMCRTPDTIPGRSGVMVSTEDVLPTLLELCGWTGVNYPLTGRSFARAWQGDESAIRDHIIGVESSRQASLCWRTDTWKFIQPIIQDAHGQPIPNIYGQPRDPAPLLFNLQEDPQEQHDVGTQHPAVRDAMAHELEQWRAGEIAARGGDDPMLEGLSLDYNDFMARLTSRRLRG